MVRNTLLAIGFLLCTSLYSQDKGIKPDPRLYDCFTQDYINQLIKQPRLLAYYNFFLDHSYEVRGTDQGKPVESIDISEVKTLDNGLGNGGKAFAEDLTKFNPANFNPLKYDFKTDAELTRCYKLGNTGKMLVFLPATVFDRMYKEYLKSLNIE
jgi:hypothetical protein